MIKELVNFLKKRITPGKDKLLARFFKTGKGEYGEGDKFLGVMVPVQRNAAKKFYSFFTFDKLESLLKSPYHECRLTALLMLVLKYKKGNEKIQKKCFDFYLKNTSKINNWDLVDLSAPNIVGDYLLNKDKKILYKLVRSSNLWEKRIAVLSSFAFIKNAQYDDSLKIAEILLRDEHDLIHKAVGWMLREIGKKDLKKEEKFLDKYVALMPRTTLRYAIEKFPEKRRQFYLKK